MANDLNRCEFIGRLGSDPETRYLPSGGAVVNLRLATSRTWKDKNSGQKQERTEWIPVTVYERLAEICAEYLRKGSQVYIAGRFQTREFEKDGQKQYRSEIIAQDMQMLGSGRGSTDKPQSDKPRSGKPPSRSDSGGSSDDFDDDIPF